MQMLLLPFRLRYITLTIALAAAVTCCVFAQIWPVSWIPFGVAVALSLLGLHDLVQTQHSVGPLWASTWRGKVDSRSGE